MLRTIGFLDHHISKNEMASIELRWFCNKMTSKKVMLVMGVTARKQSEFKCLAANLPNLVKLCMTGYEQ